MGQLNGAGWVNTLPVVALKGLDLALKAAKTTSDEVFHKLLAQLNLYVIIAHETPRKINNNAQMLEDNAALRKRLSYAEAEFRLLKAQNNDHGNLLGLARKEVIDIYPEEKRPKLFAGDLTGLCYDAINRLDPFFQNPDYMPRLVYIMCGPFAAGKSRWIRNHKPPCQGFVLYLDGTNHTADFRSLFLKRIRSLNPESRIVCCRVFSNLDECLERNADASRKRMGLTVPEVVLRHVDSNFIDVTVHEGFDAIELVGETA